MDRVRYDNFRKGTYLWEILVQTGFITSLMSTSKLTPIATDVGFPIGFKKRKGQDSETPARN